MMNYEKKTISKINLRPGRLSQVIYLLCPVLGVLPYSLLYLLESVFIIASLKG
jgi:hypothetical protein